MPAKLTVIEAPSILGLRPSGVESAPGALKKAGLIKLLGAGTPGATGSPAGARSSAADAASSLRPDVARTKMAVYRRKRIRRLVKVLAKGLNPLLHS